MIILFLLFLIVAIVGFAYPLSISIKAIKNKVLKIDYKDLKNKVCIFGAVFSVGFSLSILFLMLFLKYDLTNRVFPLILVGIIFSGLLYTFIFAFIHYYYGNGYSESSKKILYPLVCATWPLAIVFFFIYTNCFGDLLQYPLYNSLSFKNGMFSPLDYSRGEITFYAICILSGAVLVYFLCDHKLYKEYGKHGLIESTFLVAFPSGIIGARIGYCIENNVPFEDWYKIYEGGLTILTGAIAGIVVGALWFRFTKKQYNIWVVVDIIIPTILIAQAVGRWGNFFNTEVHGIAVDDSNWKWLPSIIWNNSHYGVSGSSLGRDLTSAGKIYVPLFFFEGIANLLGFFVLSHLFNNRLKKYTELGDACFGYLVWYGATRLLMEPLRDSVDQMTKGGFYTGWISAIIMMIGGTLLIIANHIIRSIIRNKKGNDFVSSNSLEKGIGFSSLFVVFSIVTLIIGLSLLDKGQAYKSFASLNYNSYVVGIIVLVFSLCSILCLGITIPLLIKGLNERRKNLCETSK